MGEKIKVLEIAGGFRANVNGRPVSGGVASFLRTYCPAVKNINNDLQFDFLSLRNQCFEPYRDEFEAIEGTLYCLDLQSDGIKRSVQLIYRLSKFINIHSYDVIHINLGSFFPTLCCAIAGRIAGIESIIVHSHSSGIYTTKKRVFANLFKPLLMIVATKYCACSMVAAQNLFSQRAIDSEKITIIKNAIDTDKFRYNPEKRLEIRKSLGIDRELVMGHVGRFVEVKNHSFLLAVLRSIYKKEPNVKLILLGDGELRKSIKEEAIKLGLEKQVLFLGHRADIENYLQAMDVFILPSIVEGFPISALEAQCAGLPCYISTNVSCEAKICENCKCFDLSMGASSLSETILKDISNYKERSDSSKTIQEAGYDLMDNLYNFANLFVREDR